jgi:hypothetical protein
MAFKAAKVGIADFGLFHLRAVSVNSSADESIPSG